MAVINFGKSIICENKWLSFHGLNLIRMIYKKSHAQAKMLLSCHEKEKFCVSCKNRSVLKITCLLTPILQGGIALFAVFLIKCRLYQEIARNGKKYVVLPDLGKDLGLSGKSLIFKNNLSPFHGMVYNRMLSEKTHDLSSELMSINCVGFI